MVLCCKSPSKPIHQLIMHNNKTQKNSLHFGPRILSTTHSKHTPVLTFLYMSASPNKLITSSFLKHFSISCYFLLFPGLPPALLATISSGSSHSLDLPGKVLKSSVFLPLLFSLTLPRCGRRHPWMLLLQHREPHEGTIIICLKEITMHGV